MSLCLRKWSVYVSCSSAALTDCISVSGMKLMALIIASKSLLWLFCLRCNGIRMSTKHMEQMHIVEAERCPALVTHSAADLITEAGQKDRDGETVRTNSHFSVPLDEKKKRFTILKILVRDPLPSPALDFLALADCDFWSPWGKENTVVRRKNPNGRFPSHQWMMETKLQPPSC